jgi:sulfide dehydrogenase cytochrome subunit
MQVFLQVFLQGCLLCFALATQASAQGASALLIAPAGATSCSGCHGASGSALPPLVNLTAAQIEDAMTAFSSGAREATLMNRIAKGFSADETRAIAQWIAAQSGASK